MIKIMKNGNHSLAYSRGFPEYSKKHIHIHYLIDKSTVIQNAPILEFTVEV